MSRKSKKIQKNPKSPRLNLGSGWDKKEGFVNIDKAKKVKPDLVVDIEKGLPFPDNSFEHIYSEHCLEHIEPQNWRFVLNEIARVAKHGCILELRLPFDNIGQRTNADHFRTFGWHSFDQLIKGGNRNYYSNLVLEKLSRDPTKLEKLFFYLFPFLKYEVYLKFKIVKT